MTAPAPPATPPKATPRPGIPFGDKDGALKWWGTIVKGTPPKVPASWQAKAGPVIVNKADNQYRFAGTSNADKTGNGQIAWDQDDGAGHLTGGSLYIRWGADGLTQGGADGNGGENQPLPTTPDKGGVESGIDLSWTSGLGTLLAALTDPAVWVRIGEAAAGVLLLVVAFVLLLKHEMPSIPLPI